MAARPPHPAVRRLIRYIPFFAMVAGFSAFFILGADQYVTFAMLAEFQHDLTAWVERKGVLAVVTYLLIYAATVALSVPGATVLTVAGGYLFGTAAGATYAVLAATVGAVAVFLAVRLALAEWVAKRAGRSVDRMRRGFRRNALSYMLVLRLVPLFPFWLVNLAPALLGVPLRIFTVGTLLGVVPGTVVFASLGRGISAVFERGEVPNLNVMFDPAILLPIVGLSILAMTPVIYRRFRNDR